MLHNVLLNWHIQCGGKFIPTPTLLPFPLCIYQPIKKAHSVRGKRNIFCIMIIVSFQNGMQRNLALKFLWWCLTIWQFTIFITLIRLHSFCVPVSIGWPFEYVQLTVWWYFLLQRDPFYCSLVLHSSHAPSFFLCIEFWC